MHPLRQASGINEQGAAFGRDQQNGIALSDINGRPLHYAGAKGGREGTNAIQTATPNSNATEAKVARRVRRAASMASVRAAIEATIIASEGMATRKSATDAPAR